MSRAPLSQPQGGATPPRPPGQPLAPAPAARPAPGMPPPRPPGQALAPIGSVPPPAPPAAPPGNVEPERDDNKQLTRAGMETVIKQGGTVLYKSRHIGRVEDLPSEGELSGNDPARRQQALDGIRQQREHLDRQERELLSAGPRAEAGAQADIARRGRGRNVGEPDRGEGAGADKGTGDNPEKGTSGEGGAKE